MCRRFLRRYPWRVVVNVDVLATQVPEGCDSPCFGRGVRGEVAGQGIEIEATALLKVQ
jgi:hypothetical protein